METRVKICGITNWEDARVAVEAGADLLGFIFFEPSPRYVRPELVRSMVAAVKQGAGSSGAEAQGSGGASRASALGLMEEVPRSTSHVTCVGVFVNEALETVRQILDFCQLDAVQLHGEESPAEVAGFAGIAYKALRPKSVAEAYELVAAYTPLPEQKAGSRKQEEQLAISNEQLTNPAFQPSGFPAFQPSNLPTLLLDAYHPHLYGGTGNRVDWAIAAEIARTQRLMLAGSLTPENVAEAVRAVRPWGVDVSSGVEATKGKKDHGKVRAFVNNVKRKT